MTDPDSPLVGRARRELDERARGLDDITIARLRAARLRALDVATVSPWRSRWMAAAGLATTAVAVVLVAGHFWLRPPSTPAQAVAGLEDLELLSSREQPEFFRELDFYDWLAHRRNGTG